MKNLMKTQISIAIAALFLTGGTALYAATTTENVDDASAISTTTGVSENGSVDVTKKGDPINDTTTGTNK